MRQLHKFVALLVALSAGRLTAQGNQHPPMLHLVIVQGAPKGNAHAEVWIMRESRNVVVVDKQATPADLEAAVYTATHIRAEVGDTITKDIRAVVRKTNGREPEPGSPRADRRKAIANGLRILDGRSPSDVKGFGRVKKLDFITPAVAPKASTPPLAS